MGKIALIQGDKTVACNKQTTADNFMINIYHLTVNNSEKRNLAIAIQLLIIFYCRINKSW
jgi:hypothetical protein